MPASPRQLRVLHLVSRGAIAPALQQSLFMPLVSRLPKQRVKTEVVTFARGFSPAAVLRQSGVPVHEIGFSRARFSIGAFKELTLIARRFRPDVIQAWGTTAQILAASLRSRCSWGPKVLWSITDTAPSGPKAGFIDRQKLKQLIKQSGRADRIVYASDVSATQHVRAGFADGEHEVIRPGVDAVRFKPDANARRRVREQLGIAPNAFVIGMIGPCLPEYDHATLLKGVGELIKTNPNLALILAGHGVQKGNAALMALVGGGTMGTRTKLLGEWSDLSSFYNACDVACSTALNDAQRMSLAVAMLCGTPCVATGIGAQGELLGEFGIAIEPGSPTALMRGIMRVLQMAPERRTFLAHGARKHALKHYAGVKSLQSYLQLYFDIAGREASAAEEVPLPEIDSSIPALPADLQAAPQSAPKDRPQVSDESKDEWADPDSLETRSKSTPAAASDSQDPIKSVSVWATATQEDSLATRATPAQGIVIKPASQGDVLQVLEAAKSEASQSSAMNERARGVAEDMDDLIAPEILETKVERTIVPVASAQFKQRKKEKAAASPATSAPEPPPVKWKERVLDSTPPVAKPDATSPVAPVTAPVVPPPVAVPLTLEASLEFAAPATMSSPLVNVSAAVMLPSALALTPSIAAVESGYSLNNLEDTLPGVVADALIGGALQAPSNEPSPSSQPVTTAEPAARPVAATSSPAELEQQVDLFDSVTRVSA